MKSLTSRFGVLVALCCCLDTQSTATSSPTASPTAPCTFALQCLASDECNRCLRALQPYANAAVGNSFIDPPVAYVAARRHELEFFSVLQSPVCDPNRTATSLPLLGPTLRELTLSFQGQIRNSCTDQVGFTVGNCQLVEFSCAIQPHCRACLNNLYNNTDTSDAFASAACRATNPAMLMLLAYGDNFVGCQAFPSCTYSKKQCLGSSQCSACLTLLQQGNSGGAATQCASSDAARLINSVVTDCVFTNQLGCDFWRHRCEVVPECSACLRALGDGEDAGMVVSGLLSQNCTPLQTNEVLALPLVRLFASCPLSTISTCTAVTFFCVRGDPHCAGCLNGTYDPTSPTCQALTNATGFGVDSGCQPCSQSVFLINRVVIATSAIGGVSACLCLLAVFLIIAHSHDLVSMRDRIIIGLMMANVMYSSANMIPMNMLHSNRIQCGQILLKFDVIRFGRAWWFGGKYALVCFEIFIIGASIWALLYGARKISTRSETALHILCVSGGAAAFTAFFVQCGQINHDGFNAITQQEVQNGAVQNLGRDDDMDDDAPGTAAAHRFDAARSNFAVLEQQMLQVWVGALMVAVVLWIYLRVAYTKMVGRWRASLAEVRAAEATDDWASTRRSAWQAQRELIVMQREAYDEVARPLELYVVVFVLFGIPAIFMATTSCQQDSSAHGKVEVSGNGDVAIVYGTCYVWCELVLSFRSLATASVFFLARERRKELRNLGTAGKKLRNRLAMCCCASTRPAAPVDGEELGLLITKPSTDWRISSSEVDLAVELASGSFGTVWRGQWQGRVVAVKVLKSGEVDEHGDPLDPVAVEEFRKECAMLERLEHPHLLRFYGYGLNESGNGFLVTELMGLGSLRHVLLDHTMPLPWRERMSIAHQLSLGMEHLHGIPIVHRDLKSDNALLNHSDTHRNGEGYVAKIADFGTSRVFRPRKPEELYSAFTGARRSAPPAATLAPQVPVTRVTAMVSPAFLTVGVCDVHGTMTKAVGTLLWMAPEVYRGDRNYGPQADVYSFGIILWELTTRSTPWDEFGDQGYLELIEMLTQALKTDRRPIIPAGVESEYPEFVSVIRQCWVGDPQERPSFATIAKDLGQQVAQLRLSGAPDQSTSTLMQPLLSQ